MRPFVRSTHVITVAISLAAGALLVSCGDDGAGPPGDGAFAGTISVLDNRFSPQDVTIAVGDSVTWRWRGSNSHSVTEGTTPNDAQEPNRLFDEGPRVTGSFGYRFTTAGTVRYFCRPHFGAGMKGTITVTAP